MGDTAYPPLVHAQESVPRDAFRPLPDPCPSGRGQRGFTAAHLYAGPLHLVLTTLHRDGAIGGFT